MRLTFLLPLIVVCVAARTHATDFKLPPAKAVATVDIPTTWKPEAIVRGVQAQSDDGTVYLSLEGTADVGEMGKIIDESDAMLKTRKVVLSRATRKDNKFNFNGLPAEELVYSGQDEDGPVTVSFTFVTIRDAAIVVTYWASVDGDKKHHAEVGKILGSFKGVAASGPPAPVKP